MPTCIPTANATYAPRATLATLYPPELLAETVRIAQRCTFNLRHLQYEYPHELVPPGHTPTQWLRILTERGAAERWPHGVPDKARRLIEHELGVIERLKYESYFLTVYDLVRFARSKDILCQGRGSAANSAVCYALGITAIDPDRIGMLFERFISEERKERPDIDIDFEHDRREEVIQYIFSHYGPSAPRWPRWRSATTRAARYATWRAHWACPATPSMRCPPHWASATRWSRRRNCCASAASIRTRR